jgi:hypothetical protein
MIIAHREQIINRGLLVDAGLWIYYRYCLADEGYVQWHDSLLLE